MLVPWGIGTRCDAESLNETELDSRSVDDGGILDSWLVSHGNFFSEAATTIYVRRFFQFNAMCWVQVRVFERIGVRVRSMSHPNRRENEDLDVGNGQKKHERWRRFPVLFLSRA